VRNGQKQPVSIDFLIDYPSVTSVVANQIVRARRPLPQIRELFVLNRSQTVDQETLSNLPGLVSLSLGSAFVTQAVELEDYETYDFNSDKIDLSVLCSMPDLRDLRFNAFLARSIEPLQEMEGLERLGLSGRMLANGM